MVEGVNDIYVAGDLVNVDLFVQVDSTVTEKRRQNCQMLVAGIKSERCLHNAVKKKVVATIVQSSLNLLYVPSVQCL